MTEYWSFPYASQRMPVLAGNVVATSQPLAAQAGLLAMQQGGNATDAAIAAAIALTVVEPTSNGIGADAFALVWDRGKLHGLNASGRSPAALGVEQFQGHAEMPRTGWDAVTVPGAVGAWAALSTRFGRLPFEVLFNAAVDYASSGFPVSPLTAAAWARAAMRFRDFEHFAATFLPEGRAPSAGESFVCEPQAETLELIAETNGRAFYEGEIADRIVGCARDAGGRMSVDDLATHSCEWVDPLSVDYRDLTLCELPPNGQGIAALIALGLLTHRDLREHPPDSADTLHLQIEAMKIALADTRRFVADPEAMTTPASALLEPGRLAERAAAIDPGSASDPGHGGGGYSSTVYLATGDEGGQMVSYIQSNYEGFGSGVVIPETGIAMQNRGAGFTLDPRHPNVVAGGKRPYHTIIPAFVLRDGAPLMALGVMGGPMQPQGHVQVMVRLADYGQNPQAALDASRWRVEAGRHVVVEPGFAAPVLTELERRGHEIEHAPERSVQHGGGQIVARGGAAYLGASDGRRDGQAVGF
ncbi:MAG: gamma-glutamyltransferase family protein [Phycisphaerae bacterium]|nr:gamma-glutamyltransferase family protein [Phycisphaerae bacterium]